MAQHLTTKHDMTFLPNCLLLREQFQKDIAMVSRGAMRLALHLLDLDGFKAVNDLYGHPPEILSWRKWPVGCWRTVRAADTVARLGSDEFVVVRVGIAQNGEAEMLARRLIRSLSEPYLIDGEKLQMSASVGIALAPDQGQDLEHLIACADGALYRSKAGGEGQLRFCGSEDRHMSLQAAA